MAIRNGKVTTNILFHDKLVLANVLITQWHGDNIGDLKELIGDRWIGAKRNMKNGEELLEVYIFSNRRVFLRRGDYLAYNPKKKTFRKAKEVFFTDGNG